MVAVSRKPAPRARRSNEERSAETRGRLIEATIDCLNRVGYAGSTTILVSDTSGVTRGGMLHHFPSKVDLMIATAEHCIDHMSEERRRRQQGGADTRAVLDVERSRFGIALTEIMLGSRSDPALADRFKPVGELILARQRRAAAMTTEREGLEDPAVMEAMVWLTMGAIRGMSLMQLAGVDSGYTDQALTLLRKLRNVIVEEAKAEQAERKGKKAG